MAMHPLPPDIAPSDASGVGMHPLPPDVAPSDTSGAGMHPLPPDIAPRDTSVSGMHPLPPDVASSGAGNPVIGSQSPDLSGGIESKLSQIDLFHSMQSARAYALNSIVDALDREAFGIIA